MNFKKVVAKFLAIICVIGIIAISLPVESLAIIRANEQPPKMDNEDVYIHSLNI